MKLASQVAVQIIGSTGNSEKDGCHQIPDGATDEQKSHHKGNKADADQSDDVRGGSESELIMLFGGFGVHAAI